MNETEQMAAAGIGLFAILVYLAIVFFMIASMWKIFGKAGKPGWAAIVPIYNLVVLLEVTRKPTWWIILMLIPLVNVIVSIIIVHQLSVSFGKDTGFTIGLLLLPIIFLPILAFGDAKYIGTSENSSANSI